MKGSGRPVWEDTAPPEDLAQLDPGVPPEWDPRPDVLVVGGGVMGLAVAASCTRAGMRVLLVERDRLASAASGRAAGGLSPDAHPEHGESWRELARESLALHRTLDAEWDYGLRSVDLLIPPDYRLRQQAHVNPLRLAAALARRAGTVATGVAFTGWDLDGDRVVRVHTTHGPVTPGSVVVATGVAPDQCPTNERWIKGHLIATEPAPFELADLIAFDILVVQLADGRLVAGGTRDVSDTADTVDDVVIAGIESRLVDLVPAARGLARTHAWSCFRPCAADELPIVDQPTELSNVWVATGAFTTGLLMAPVIGRLITDWISIGRPLGIDRFSLGRAVG